MIRLRPCHLLDLYHNSQISKTTRLAASHMARPTQLDKETQWSIDKKANPSLPTIARSADIQIIKSHIDNSPASILVNAGGKGYLFNCGEGFQRLCFGNKIKISNLERLFVTNLHWQNVSGTLGLSLTLKSLNINDFVIHSTEGIEEFYKSANTFTKLLNAMKCETKIWSHDDVYDDSKLRVKPIIIDTSTIDRDNDDQVVIKRFKKSSKLVAYECTLPDEVGRLDPQKCRQLNVPIGPKLALLKSGVDVTLDDGTMIKSSDVCAPKVRGFNFLIVDCPTLDMMKHLTQNKPLSELWRNRSAKDDKQVDLVVHLTPKDVLNDQIYKDWMNGFSDECKHIAVADKDSRRLDVTGSYRLHHVLNKLDKDIFPELYMPEQIRVLIDKENGESKTENNVLFDPEIEPEYLVVGDLTDQNNIIAPSHLDRIVLRPKKLYVSTTDQHALDFIYEAAKGDSIIGPQIEQYQRWLKSQPEPAPHEPEVVFLGTGSSVPSKYRNTSLILVNVPGRPGKSPSPPQSFILDCGEGSYWQIVKFYGPTKAKEILANLRMIYVSHFHADHHSGLIEILRQRKKIPGLRRIPLVIPSDVEAYLDFHNENFEDLSHTYEIFITHDLKLYPTCNYSYIESMVKKLSHLTDGLIANLKIVEVEHCKNSCAVVVQLKTEHPEGKHFSLAYSGDTRPSLPFIELGKNCDLLIHEATFDQREMTHALEKKHSTSSEAIEVGKRMRAKNTILTHFSQKYSRIPSFTEEFDDTIGYSFDFLALRCPTHLNRLPKLKGVLHDMFKHSLNNVNAKYEKMGYRAMQLSRVKSNRL